MKNQYFGDINDFRKYGLLRTLTQETGLRCLVAWMLTPDDGRSDGSFTNYLDAPETWRGYDPELFDTLRRFLRGNGSRDLTLLESSGLLPNTSFFADVVPDQRSKRERWFEQLLTACSDSDLVFFDPDNGIEVKSVPFGRAKSSKYVYWSELREAFSRGVSLIVYQHFPRTRREKFIADQAGRFAQVVGIERVLTFQTGRVLFLLAPQPFHEHKLCLAAEAVARKWKDQFQFTMVSHGDTLPLSGRSATR